MSKISLLMKNKVVQTTLMVGLMAVASSSMAAETGTATSITDFITAETLKPIVDSILTVAGLAIGAGFTVLGVIVAAKSGMGLVKAFLSRASS